LPNSGNKSSPNNNNSIVVKIVPFGPTVKNINSLRSKLISHPKVRSYLKGISDERSIREDQEEEGLEQKKRTITNKQTPRLLSFELLPEAATTASNRVVMPKSYLSKYYDYDNNCCITIKGKLGQSKPTEIVESKEQPLPNKEEFEEAVRIITESGDDLAQAIRNKTLKPYRPMPPLFIKETSTGDIERTLCVGLRPIDSSGNNISTTTNNNHSKYPRHEIVAVNMINKAVTRFDSRAPENSRADESMCGFPETDQETTDRGTPGSAKVTVTKGGKLLWDFIVTRPAASSGTNGSGIELQYVNYKGKRVFRRANAPILNVKYDEVGCGPYRDAEYEENMIEADGDDVAPGFRLCPTPARTILDTGNDLGNYLGVAVYVDNGGGASEQEVVLVSEMSAGWYRYISEWRLNTNGTIKPRFGFGAVSDSCVCNPHHHHVYWRLNFDVGGSKKNTVEEYNDPPISGQSNWHTVKYETMRMRNPSSNRKWRIQNEQTGRGYMINPGPNDGTADSFGKGDIWFLRNRPNQFDDGIQAGPPYEAQIDDFVNHERIKNRDIVVWYGAHFTHVETADGDSGGSNAGTTGHIVGPDLIPFD
jgi:hypothetical protein